MIKPSIGRVVWFHPSITDHSLASGGDQPLAALVSHVWSDTCVNLAVFDANGNTHSKTSVLLLQDDAIAPEGGYYAEWMPFQKGQAVKQEAGTSREARERALVMLGNIEARHLPAALREAEEIARFIETGELRTEVQVKD